jgi:ribonuclease HI
MMDFMATPLALEPGKTEVTLFGDGSFQDLISVGSWAFYAPDFDLANAGMEPGQTVEHFESVALLAGLEAILSIDRTRRPIHIFTDCDAAIELIRSAAGHKGLSTGSVMQRVQHLFERASLLTAQRRVLLTRTASGSTPGNKRCHQLASLKLRSGMAADPALSSQLAMHRQKQRLTTIKQEGTSCFTTEIGSARERGANNRGSSAEGQFAGSRRSNRCGRQCPRSSCNECGKPLRLRF